MIAVDPTQQGTWIGLDFDEEARIREFYGPGDHKVVFWKQIN